jgi:cystathionine beta-lyase
VSFDDLDLMELRRRRGAKWSRCASDAIPAWVADMDYPVAEPIRAVLRQMIEASDLGYPQGPDPEGLATVFARRMRERFGWDVDPHRVEVLTDVVQGLHLSVELFSNPGDGVVTPLPIYPPFLDAVSGNGRRPVWQRFELTADGYRIDFERLRAEFVPDTRVMLVCNPHNPTGRVLTRAELGELAALAIERDMVIVSDEIHADLVYGGHRHVPLATLSPGIAERTITLTSASKAFNIAGLRCAVAAFGSAELHRRFRSVHHHARGGIGALGLAATEAAWTQGDEWLRDVVRCLEANRDLVAGHIASRWPLVRAGIPEATYLYWMDFSAAGLPSLPGDFLLEKARVMLAAGGPFGEGFEACARLNFATSTGILREILGRMDDAMAAGRGQ